MAAESPVKPHPGDYGDYRGDDDQCESEGQIRCPLGVRHLGLLRIARGGMAHKGAGKIIDSSSIIGYTF